MYIPIRTYGKEAHHHHAALNVKKSRLKIKPSCHAFFLHIYSMKKRCKTNDYKDRDKFGRKISNNAMPTVSLRLKCILNE